MLMQELGRIIQEDPNLCAMAMVDKRKYIISKWNASHSEPIDEGKSAVQNLNSAIKLLCTDCFNAAR